MSSKDTLKVATDQRQKAANIQKEMKSIRDQDQAEIKRMQSVAAEHLKFAQKHDTNQEPELAANERQQAENQQNLAQQLQQKMDREIDGLQSEYNYHMSEADRLEKQAHAEKDQELKDAQKKAEEENKSGMVEKIVKMERFL